MDLVISQLAERLRDAEIVTAELFSDVIRDTCRRLPSLRRTNDFARFEQLIRLGAWTEAALALLALELPQWHLRHIAHDAGEWRCLLSRRRALPDWLDQPLEGCHADLTLAILSAYIEAKRGDTLPDESAANLSKDDPVLDVPLGCDNFS